MCGLVALVSGDPRDHELLEKATDILSHRGPDSRGFYRDGNVGLGHRRLSILDLSEAGAQPMKSEDGNIVLVCNGEIYNYKEENERLAARGIQLRSKSDSETLIHLYAGMGDEFLSRVNGMFAFALWDAGRRRLVAAVDRFGKKPLYYTTSGGRLALASEAKSLLLFDWVSREPDPGAIDRYLTLRYVPAPMTMFRGIKKLEPATMMIWETGRGAGLEDPVTRRYWRPRRRETIQYGEAAVDAFEELFTDAVRIRTRSDVPLGLYLSGGVDSAAVGGVMRKLSPERRITYTLSVDYKGDERERAKRIADHLGFEFNPVTVSDGDFALTPKISYHLDEPLGDLLCVPSYLLAQKAREKLTVVLTGDGADEILNGYFHQRVMDRWRRLSPLLKTPGMGAALSAAVRLVPAGLLNMFFDYPDRFGRREKLKLAHALEGCAGMGAFYEGLTSCFTAQDKKRLYTARFAAGLGLEPFSEEFEREARGLEGFAFYSKLSVLDLKYWIPFSVLFRLDKLNMAHAVETRSPFLDYRVVEMALNLSDEGKLNPMRNKEILRRLVERLYPPNLREEGKQAFYMPVTERSRRGFEEWARALLTEKSAARRGVFEWSGVRELLDQLGAGSMLVNRQIAALAMLELWFKTFVDTPAAP